MSSICEWIFYHKFAKKESGNRNTASKGCIKNFIVNYFSFRLFYSFVRNPLGMHRSVGTKSTPNTPHSVGTHPTAVIAHETRTHPRLENIESKMITGVVRTLSGIKIDPILIVGWNPHLCRVAMIQIRSALVVFRGVVIVRIIHVRIVIEPLPILCIGSCPLLTIRLLCRSGIGKEKQANRAENGKRN